MANPHGDRTLPNNQIGLWQGCFSTSIGDDRKMKGGNTTGKCRKKNCRHLIGNMRTKNKRLQARRTSLCCRVARRACKQQALASSKMPTTNCSDTSRSARSASEARRNPGHCASSSCLVTRANVVVGMTNSCGTTQKNPQRSTKPFAAPTGLHQNLPHKQERL